MTVPTPHDDESTLARRAAAVGSLGGVTAGARGFVPAARSTGDLEWRSAVPRQRWIDEDPIPKTMILDYGEGEGLLR